MSCDAAVLGARLAGHLPPGRLLVAFSGGVDSTLVLAAALRERGAGAVRAVTADSPSLARAELAEATALAARLGAAHDVMATRELERPGYRANGGDRCFHCRTELYGRLAAGAAAAGFDAIVDGVNRDDLGDHRPGLRAAAASGVRHPLADAGLDKPAVRRLSAAWGLPTHDKPAAPCLASRIPYGQPVTAQRRERWAEIEGDLLALGYRAAEAEPEGLRSGRLNDALPELGASA